MFLEILPELDSLAVGDRLPDGWFIEGRVSFECRPFWERNIIPVLYSFHNGRRHREEHHIDSGGLHGRMASVWTSERLEVTIIKNHDALQSAWMTGMVWQLATHG